MCNDEEYRDAAKPIERGDVLCLKTMHNWEQTNDISNSSARGRRPPTSCRWFVDHGCHCGRSTLRDHRCETGGLHEMQGCCGFALNPLRRSRSDREHRVISHAECEA